ncbi:GNAT family N-acetyltransferase [bacterium]|nr:GNAT family N-acetyltransferase [bacterium]
MLSQATDPTSATPFTVRLATSAADIRAAQRLRYEVFALEMGARLASADSGLDRDRWDEHCDHLLVGERGSGRVVGTYRMLPPARAAAAGGWYCGEEFDVSRLLAARQRIVEVGRACVDPAYRSGLVIALLWAGLMRYLRRHGGAYAIGCASIGTEDGGHLAASICRRVLRDHLAPPAWRVTPRQAFVLEGWEDVADPTLPPLLKGYLRLGADVCGPPAWDPAFRTADLLIRLDVARANPRYVDRLLRAA